MGMFVQTHFLTMSFVGLSYLLVVNNVLLQVPQGGAFGMASVGAGVLAREVVSFWVQNGQGRPLSVCLPGGTCSTAVLLHHELKILQGKSSDPIDIEIVVIPCVGSAGYARRQMMALSAEIGAEVEDIPAILQPAPESGEKAASYYSFGQPDKSILQTFKMMEDDHGVFLDLIYGAPAWTVLLKHWNVTLSPDLWYVSNTSLPMTLLSILTHDVYVFCRHSFDPNNPIAGREVLYIHCGGREGINSQLLRYKYKGLVATKDIQLPGRSKK
jgi:1-aminocyclopropane-1-carboxylate deaminase/D-cysteine desulfhydrase-like pyridoxal-dependent ACC family enzyme